MNRFKMGDKTISKLVSGVFIVLFCSIFGTGFMLFGSENIQAPRNSPSIGRGETSFLGPSLMNVPKGDSITGCFGRPQHGDDIPAYSGVYLHSGEFFLEEHDLVLPGRGFDFDFHCIYKSQSIFSGPLGWN